LWSAITSPSAISTESVGVPVTAKRRSPNCRSRIGRVRVSERLVPDWSSAGATIQTSSDSVAAIRSSAASPGA
jgi:hypothetical protein